MILTIICAWIAFMLGKHPPLLFVMLSAVAETVFWCAVASAHGG